MSNFDEVKGVTGTWIKLMLINGRTIANIEIAKR
jgi:hypothetical protein